MASIALDVIVHEKYIEKSWIHFKLIGNYDITRKRASANDERI